MAGTQAGTGDKLECESNHEKESGGRAGVGWIMQWRGGSKAASLEWEAKC